MRTSIRASLLCALIFLLMMLPLCFPWQRGQAQSGALVPSSIKDRPDAAILSLQVMNVDVRIDNQHATVKVLQIFDNHVERELEGKYLFALPPKASISDFAIWENNTRIPGVILEKRRANQIYTQLTQNQIDPGLLQQDDEHGGKSAFSAKVFPIPAYGSKRIELEYTEILPIEGLASSFTFPLKPSFGDPQQVGEFNLHIAITNDYPIAQLDFKSLAYPIKTLRSTANEFEGDYHAYNIFLTEDLSFNYKINILENHLSWITYRAPEQISAYDLRDPALAMSNPDGYFEAAAIFNQNMGFNDAKNSQPRNVVLVLDTSLSMYGEKLTRAVEVIDLYLHSLAPQDRFNLLLFNEETAKLDNEPLAATPENIERAMAFIRSSWLAGGTDLKSALLAAFELSRAFPEGERNIILISDANPTLGEINIKQLSRVFDRERNNGLPNARLYAIALGSDANRSLLAELTEKCHGDLLQARETEDITAQLKIFFSRIGKESIEGLRFNAQDEKNFYQVYPIDKISVFDGASYTFVGRYKNPTAQTAVAIEGNHGAEKIQINGTVALPQFDDAHPQLPRVWARARVDALLHEMDLNGEREDYISEIIRLSQKYKFVTPYTAFLAAPRALLRPRLIQPGDPVIRVKTDESITAVFAVLPFGETLPLQYLASEKVWEGRFLAPAGLPDGSYRCRLLMTDKNGNGYQEEKSLIIDSHPPKLKVQVASQTARAGEDLIIKVNADKDTARLVAKMYGAQSIQLYWSDKERANVGRLHVPAGLAAGQYVLTVSAEDFAYNQSSAEINIEVLGH